VLSVIITFDPALCRVFYVYLRLSSFIKIMHSQPNISALTSVIVTMDINNKVELLEELKEFLDSRRDSYITISTLLDQIAAVQNDSEKLLILKSSGIQKQLQERIDTLNNLCVSKLNGDITENLQHDNQKLTDFREKLNDLLKK